MSRAAAGRALRLLLAASLVLPAGALAQRRIEGQMPRFGPSPAAEAAGSGLTLAPTPDLDAHAPQAAASDQPQLVPAFTNRLSGGDSGGQGYSPGSAYPAELERQHGDLGTNIGSVLAPGLQLRVPLR